MRERTAPLQKRGGAVRFFYYSHSEAEITAYCRDVIEAAGMKAVPYNIPAFTGVSPNKKNCIDAMQNFGFFAALKYMLTLMGLPGGVRRPLLDLSDGEKKQVEEIYVRYLK